MAGDALDNNFRFEQSTGGTRQVAGIDTSINGVLNGTFDFTAITGNVVVRSHEGNDNISLVYAPGSGSFPGALVVETGAGDDQFTGGAGATIGGDLIIDLGTGNDNVNMRGSTFRDGSGPGIFIGQSMVITSGDGNDAVQISELFEVDDVVINSGAGPDRVSLLFVFASNFIGMDGGAGDDSLSVSRTDARVMSLRSGPGSDLLAATLCETTSDLGMIGSDGFINIRVTTTKVGGTAYLIGSSVNDYVQVEASQFREQQVNTSSGSDRVDINGSLLERVFAELGADGDLLVMNNTAISGQGSLSGGVGYDVFFGRGNAFGGATLAFFEAFT
jgi:hypothetical protein